MPKGHHFDFVIQNPPYGSKRSGLGGDIHYRFVDKCSQFSKKQLVIMPFKIVYDKKQLKNQHYKTFEVLASANIAKNTILKSFYTNGHKRTFKKENLNKVIEIIELNKK